MTTDNPNLSDREIEILNLLGQGKSNKDIAQELFISINTVKVHVNNIYKKLGVSSRTEATVYAIEHGLIENPRSEAEPVHIYIPVSKTSNEEMNQTPAISSKYWWLVVMAGLGLIIGLSLLLSKNKNSLAPTPTVNPIINTLNQERWWELSDIPTPRKNMAITVWDGSIYTIAGSTVDGPSDVIERFNSSTNQWDVLSNKPTPVTHAQAATLGGKIYVPGGTRKNGTISSIMEVYDPRTDKWSVLEDLPFPVSHYGLTTFEGNIYLFGGWDGKKDLDTAWVFNPNQEEWRELPPMPVARTEFTVVPLGDKLYFFGGKCKGKPCLQSFTFSPNLENSDESAWNEQILLDSSIDFIGAQEVSGSLFLFGLAEEGMIELKNYTPQNNMWYTYSEKPTVVPNPGTQLVSIGGNVFFLGGNTSEDTPSEKLIRYQAVYTIVLPQIGN